MYDAVDLRTILERHARWLQGEDDGEPAVLSGLRLCWTDLTGVDLRRANLTGAILTGVNFHKADLRGSILVKADLRWADLTEAKLNSADLSGANLRRAYLRGTDLTGAKLEGARLDEIVEGDIIVGPKKDQTH